MDSRGYQRSEKCGGGGGRSNSKVGDRLFLPILPISHPRNVTATLPIYKGAERVGRVKEDAQEEFNLIHPVLKLLAGDAVSFGGRVWTVRVCVVFQTEFYVLFI